MKALIARGGSVADVAKLADDRLGDLLREHRIAFWRQKTSYLKRAAQQILDKHNGRVPDSLKELKQLPGVGNKMAHLVLQEAFDRIEGVSVDSHVHRCANRLGWVRSSSADETKDQLEQLLPQGKHWKLVNGLLGHFGAHTCLPRKPKCGDCPLKDICPRIGVTDVEDL